MSKAPPAAEAKPAEAAAAPVAEAGAAPARRKMRKKWKILLILFSLVMMALLRTGFVFLVIAMLPSIVMYYFDQSEHRYTYKTILYCNLAGAMPFIGQLLRYGPSSMNLQAVMTNPDSWIIIYGAAAMGGILISITPQIARMMIGSLHTTQIKNLERSQKKIEQEWGTEVTQFGGQAKA